MQPRLPSSPALSVDLLTFWGVEAAAEGRSCRAQLGRGILDLKIWPGRTHQKRQRCSWDSGTLLCCAVLCFSRGVPPSSYSASISSNVCTAQMWPSTKQQALVGGLLQARQAAQHADRSSGRDEAFVMCQQTRRVQGRVVCMLMMKARARHMWLTM